MRAILPETETMKVHVGSRSGTRLKQLRKMHLRSFSLEALEQRTLMATIPAALVAGQVNISNSGGNQSSPSISVNPLNSQQLAAVWTRLDANLAPNPTVIVEGAFSNNGGASWTGFTPSAQVNDFTSTTVPPPLFAQATDASVDFDRNNNFYVVDSQHTADNTAGVLFLNKFNVSGGAPASVIANKAIYSWTGDQAIKPTLAVDKNVAFFSDGGGKTQTDLGAGNVYVAWASADVAPPNAVNFDPNAIRVISSSDGGQSFTGFATANDNGNSGAQRNTSPRLTISQGSTGVTGGQVTVAWDDFGSLATATPTPLDAIKVDRFQAPVSQTFSAAGGPIKDADPNIVPNPTSFNIVVPAGTSINANDLTIHLRVDHAAVAELQFDLKAPNGTTVTLIPTAGVTGVNLGAGQFDTILSAASPRSLANGTAPYIGSFRPVNGLGTLLGPVQTGTWQLIVTDSTANNVGALVRASLTFSSGINFGVDRTVAQTTVRGAQGNTYGTASAASPLGIGPSPVLASDNTLGSFSPNQGRLYLTYVDRFDSNITTFTGNPADNTDVFMLVSDNGGVTWTNPATGGSANPFRGYDGERVNNDLSRIDGFTESTNIGTAGRAQFEPSVAVDQTTGSVVVTYYDGRYDAARSRVAYSIAASIDGGASFGPQAFANAPLTVRDQATGLNSVLGPIPDNESAGNTATGNDRATFAFGDRQSVAVAGGHVYPIWSSNQNGGFDGKALLNIRVAQATIAAGPRIISSSMGAIGLDGLGATLDPLNTTTTADGTPIVSSFTVTFDRPVDRNTFDKTDVVVQYRDVNGNTSNVPVINVTPTVSNAFGSTQFRIDFSPRSGVGTYSYEILSSISDRIRTPLSNGNLIDQNANGTPGQATDFYAAPTPTGTTAFSAPYKQDTLPLIIPGPHVVATQVPGSVKTVDNLVLNGTISAINVTFDRDMNASTFTAAQVLRIQGPAGVINGPFTVTANPLGTDPNPLFPRTFQIGFPKQQLNGTYTITLGSTLTSKAGDAVDVNLNAGVDVLKGVSTTAPTSISISANDPPIIIQPGQTVSSQIVVSSDFLIQGLTLQLDITFPNDPDLTLALVAPDGTVINLAKAVGQTGTNANFTNTIFDDGATTPITNGGPPYFGRFRPMSPLGVLNGASSVSGPGGTGLGVYQLQVTNNSATLSGSINAFSLTLLRPASGTGLGEPVADRTQLTFRIFTMDPTNPISSTTWTSVGPASIGGSRSGRVGGLAVDPSDPSGNTVYVAGASGGVWKTNNFLTTSSAGPTYIPLTDFGPTFGVNIGGLAVFGRNNDPNQSIIFAATGEGDTGSTGVGFLRSMDGGASWTLLDSTDNAQAYANRDHAFVGSTAFKVVVDPRPSATGQVIVYAALSGNNGGIWRSLDTGKTWGQVDPNTGARAANLPGQAIDVVLDPNSGPVDAVSNPTGNLQVVYGALRGQGVFISPNQAQVWNIMNGGAGDPLIQDPMINPAKPIPVNNDTVNPNGPKGRIVLAKPDLFPSSDPNAALKNFIYQGFLYAAVVTPDNHLDGLYMTKDQGQNWVRVRIPTLPPAGGTPPGVRAIPSNDTGLNDYDVLGNTQFAQGNYDVSLVIDPTNPNVVYLGGTADGQPSGLLRVDTTAISDAHSDYLANDSSGAAPLSVNSTDAVALTTPTTGFNDTPTINLIRNPSNPLGGNATFYVNNIASFANTGAGVKWIPFDKALGGSTDQHRAIAIRDPLTGHARLIFGDDQGVFTAVDLGDGTLSPGIGSQAGVTGTRNGNLQITQFYYGAVQPSSAAAQIAGALFYGSAQDDGSPRSTANELSTGNLSWTGPGGDYTGVATDQTGSGTLYQYAWPCCGGNVTDFFQVNGVGRTNGLIQVSSGGNVPDPQWPFLGGFNFAVNPINGNQIIMGSGAGRLFRTEDQGKFWLVIADPAALDGSTIPALAFGAPDPATSNGSLDNFLYVGTNGGNIFVTFTGGGASGNNWFNITNGDLAADGSAVQAIVTNPTRGSHEAYAVTNGGVYYIADSLPSAGQTWQRITGNVFQQTIDPFGDPSLRQTQLKYLTSIQADWRYILPDDPANPGGPKHPVLYVAGEGGVFRSLDKGATWLSYPTNEVNSLALQPIPPGTGGGLPDAHVTDLDMSIGNIDPTTGRAVIAPGDPNLLVASTFGRGTFGIRLAPLVMPNTTIPTPNWLFLDPASLAGITSTGQQYAKILTPTIDGTSEQSAFGNSVTVLLYDLTGNPAAPIPIPLTGVVTTDANGKFKLPVAAGYFKASGTYTIGVQATDQSGTKGNMALFTFVIDVAPPAPTAVVLDFSTDSGTYGNDQYTYFNNSAVVPAASNAPLFDVSGIIAPPAGQTTTVVLLRATQTNGVIGAFEVVNTTTTTTGGIVQIADNNGGSGTIADTPVNTPPDTAPNQLNQYVYQAYQIDSLNVAGLPYTSPLGVIVDTTNPTSPTKVYLDPSSDSGTSNADGYTNVVNKNGNAPLFDVEGIEPHATVVLIRTDSKNISTVVNIIQDVTPTGANSLIQIADINGNNTQIPDNPLGNPINTAAPAGNPYSYTAYQVDLAGNQSSGSAPPSFGNQGAIVLDGTDADNHGSFDTTNKVNLAGWLYMQKVLDAIRPNVTSTKRVLVALGVDPSKVGSNINASNATYAIADAFAKSGLPGSGWSLEYVNGSANIDKFLSGLPANAVTNTNASAGTITIAQTGFMYIPTVGHVLDAMSNADLTVLNKHGLDIASFVNTGAGLYSQSESGFGFGGGGGGGGGGNAPPAYGWLTALFPTIQVVAVSGFAINIQLTPLGKNIFPGLTSADLSGGPWHDYFAGTIPTSLGAVFTDTNPKTPNNPANTVILGLSAVQTNAPPPTTGNIIFDSTPPVVSTITLDPASDTGSSNTDKVTNKNNNPSPGNAPVFDVTGVEPNGIVNLYRATYNPVTGVTGPAVLVNTLTQAAAIPIGILQIGDTNNGAKIPDGYYVYTTSQTDLAGNIGPVSANLVIQVDATAPVAPNPLKLDPLTDTGTFNNDFVTKDNNGNPYPAPIFDLSSVENKATVQLFRALVINGIPGASILVNTINNVGGGIVPVPDINNGNGVIADGTYVYTAMQTDLAGNAGPLSNAVTVTINSKVPNPEPPPAPDLEAGSDSGTFNNDNITQYNNGNPYPAPIFDIGTAQQPVDKAATVELFRAKVVNGVAGVPVLVNTLTNVAGGVVAIPDINAGNGVIADGTYYYTTQLISLAGVSGSVSPALTVFIFASPPAIPTPFRLDAGSDTGVSSSDGITQITLFNHPVFDAGRILKGATLNLYRASVDALGNVGAAILVNSLQNTAGGTVQINDPTVIPDGTYVYTAQQIDLNGNFSPIGSPITIVYDTQQPNTPGKPSLDPKSDTGVKGDNVTSNTAPFLDVPTSIAGLEVNASLTLVRDGSVVARSPYNLSGGTVAIQDPGPVAYGTHVYQAYLTDLAGNISALGAPITITIANDAPGTISLDPSTDSGVQGDNITNASKPVFDVLGVQANGTLRLIRGVLTVATVPTGIGGTVKITDPGPLSNGVYVYTTQVVDSLGNISPNGPTLTITIDQNIPLAPTLFKLDSASDSGAKGDNLTNVTNPTFDASSIVVGATVNLFRDGVVVGTLSSSPGGTVTINDPGPVASGSHLYTVQQISAAGNTSPKAAPQTIVIDTSIPAGPPLSLDSASDSGIKGDNVTNVTSPFFDAANVVAGSTLKLYRNGVNVKTLLNVIGGTTLIQDPGPLADGSYTYTAQQTSPAGNISLLGPNLTITINSVAPAVPNTPILGLDPTTDSGIKGDGITSVRRPTISGSADPSVVVILFDSANKIISSTTSDALGNFKFPLSIDLADGAYSYTAQATDSKGAKSAISSPPLKVTIVTVGGDYTGDGKTDVAVFRRTDAFTMQWFVQNSAVPIGKAFGAGSLDVPLYGDFDGDGKIDLAVYRPTTAQWFVANSSTGYLGQASPIPVFGQANVDIPVPGNYNGPGPAIQAVYRPTTGEWFTAGKLTSTVVVPGQPGDVPVPGDYASNGTDQFAVFRPSTHTWYILSPSGLKTITLGTSTTDVPVPGAYDATATSHATEAAVFQPSTGVWTIKGPTATRTVLFAPNDVPAPGDYDGLGVIEPAVYRPSTANWYVQGPNDASPRLITPNGYGYPNHDLPPISPYKYRALTGGSGVIIGLGKASSTPAVGLDFGAGAVALASTGSASSTTTVSSVVSATPTQGGAPATNGRARPAQHLHVQMHNSTNTNNHHRAKVSAHAVDQALASLTGGKARRHSLNS